ncbi:MAG: tyrosyl-tRNA synthetase [Saprospiraceae bacterium]|jgi:tyrosyl-tRNA synthetase
MSFIEELTWRGMLHQKIDGIEAEMTGKSIVGYIGFDPTAASLTIGNYVQVMLLHFFQKAGHTPIILMGGATGRIGDPSGKDKERELKSFEELDSNLAFQQKQFSKFLDFDGPNAAIVVNNYDFYSNMNVLDFLRDVGKTMMVAPMLKKDSVKKRLETGLSFTEFSYQVLQGYDFQHLYSEHNCILQMGGSDQWGNIVAGTEFIKKNIENGKAFAVTTPLLTKADGTKFGKSEAGNIWLDPKMTSPYKFYQFWLGAENEDLPKFMRYFSYKTKEEIADIETEFADNPQAIQKILAEELTRRVHGDEAFESVLKVTNKLFNRKANRENLLEMSEADLELVTGEIDSFPIAKSKLENSINVADLLAEETTILKSKGEVRRSINGIKINKEKIISHEALVDKTFLLQNKYILVEIGKSKKYLIVAE